MTIEASDRRFLVIMGEGQDMGRLKGLLAKACPEALTVEGSCGFEEGVAKLVTRLYDICFIGSRVDSASGLDVLRAVANRNLGTVFVFMAPTDERPVVAEALRLGAEDYLIKGGFDQDDLEKAVLHALYRKDKALSLRASSLRDPLTGLANRALFEEQLSTALLKAKRHKERVGVLYADIQGIKSINKLYGLQAGDRLLQMAAERMSRQLRAGDDMARVGGDEFAALLSKTEGAAGLARIAAKIEKAVTEKPYRIGDIVLDIGLTVGHVLYPDNGRETGELISLAERRMREIRAERINDSPPAAT